MAKDDLIPAADCIRVVCNYLGRTRSHVSTVFRRHVKALGAKRRGGRWYAPRGTTAELKRLVKTTSGRAYKLGETGPNRRTTG